MGVNNGVKMDRVPVIFTSDVSLPKDDKNASEVNKSQLGTSTKQAFGFEQRPRHEYEPVVQAQ